MTTADPKPPTRLSRKDFLQLVTALGGTALVSFLEACTRAEITQAEYTPSPSPAPTQARPRPTLTPQAAPPSAPAAALPTTTPAEIAAGPAASLTPLPGSGTARVAFVKTTQRAEGVRQAIALLGINPVAGKTVFLKPNFNSADPAPGSTHPDVLAALVAALQEMGAAHITVGDRSGMGSTRQVMEQLGVFELSQALGFDTLVLDELGADDWVLVEPPGGHWQNGFPFARPCLQAGALVQTCCLKTHRFGGQFTLSLKNSVGMVAKRRSPDDHNFMQELHASPHQRRMIAEINAAYTPALVVMDGIEAFISGGPDAGERVSPQVILAGTDRVALDAVGVALLRQHGCTTEVGQGKIFEQEQIARAVALGLGVDQPGKIELLTADADSAAYSETIKAILLAG